MSIDNLTIKELRELKAILGGADDQGQSAFEVGKSYFIRTATFHCTGRLTAIYPQELVLEDAAWIADSGRFSAALHSGVYNEVEPFHKPVIVARGSIVDATEITTPLPREVK